MASHCHTCSRRKTCWASAHCRGTCDTCECPFDWTMTCESCKKEGCPHRGERKSEPGVWPGRPSWLK